MKCPNCGAQVPDDARFCSECGSPLQHQHTIPTPVPDPELYEERRSPKGSPQKSDDKGLKQTIKMFIITAILVLAALTIFFIGRVMRMQSQIKEAEAYMESGDYEAAYEIYKSVKVSDTKDQARIAKKCIDAQKILDNALQQKVSQQFILALSNLKTIPEEALPVYEEAQAEIKSIQEMIYTSAEQSIADGDYDGADALLNDYLLQFPGDATATGQKSQIKAKREEAEAAAKKMAEDTEKALKDAQAEQEKAAAQAQANEDHAKKVLDASAYGYSDSYLYGLYGLETTVTSATANVRSGPGIDAEIVTTVSRGSYVYIYDIQPDVGRIWCKAIITSINTGNSYDAWISSRNLDYSL